MPSFFNFIQNFFILPLFVKDISFGIEFWVVIFFNYFKDIVSMSSGFHFYKTCFIIVPWCFLPLHSFKIFLCLLFFSCRRCAFPYDFLVWDFSWLLNLWVKMIYQLWRILSNYFFILVLHFLSPLFLGSQLHILDTFYLVWNLWCSFLLYFLVYVSLL